MQNRKLIYVLAFAAAAVIAFTGRALWYYPRPGAYVRPEVPQSTPAPIRPLSEEYEAGAELDGEGRTVLVDVGHSNNFTEGELSVFFGRLTSSGAQINFVDSGSDLVQQLRRVSALIVIAPSSNFDSEEQRAIQDFVGKGGRLIVIGDPTRQRGVESLNSLAGLFNVTYLEDYIYNLVENDGGFRNVIFTEFAEDTVVTDGLKRVVFQTAYSLRADQRLALILGDEDTYSSGNEQPGGVIAAALSGGGQVLFLPDMTFLTSPYNTFADNDILINNIIRFALAGERTFDLADFPYFFDTPVQIVFLNPVTLNNSLDSAITLRTELNQNGIPAGLVEKTEAQSGVIFLALYEEADQDTLDLLEADGVTLSDKPVSEDANDRNGEGSIIVEDAVRLKRSGTVLIHLVRPAGEEGSADGAQPGRQESSGAYQVIVLAADQDMLIAGIDRLLSGDLQDCLITPATAVCRSGKAAEEGAGTALPTPTPGTGSLLVVAEDTDFEGNSEQTGAPVVVDVLDSLGYAPTLHSIFAEDVPTLADLQAYNAVLWITGEACCSVPSESSIAVLSEYLDEGGKLLIEGASLAFSLHSSERTDFLEDYLGVTYVDYGPQIDIEPASDGHPIASGFSGVMTFEVDDSILADMIDTLPGVDVVFVRGPDSASPGTPSLVAYERGPGRVVTAAFPVSALLESDLSLLLSNVVEWLTAPSG